MSNTSIDSSHTPTATYIIPSERPLIVAAYRHGDPFRKRRVKVPHNILWNEFLGLFYSRLDIRPDAELEIFDEKGIEIVSVEDLVENDVLVIKERYRTMIPPPPQILKYKPRASPQKLMKMNDPKVECEQLLPSSATQFSSYALSERTNSDHAHVISSSHDQLGSAPTPMGVPLLAHFIQSNSFGYYFLAEVDNMKVLPTHGKVKRTHCIVKVPHCTKNTGTFESEANQLRRIAGHKCIISPPAIQILNFSDDSLQTFFKSIPPQKQTLLKELFVSGGCMEAYVYPLYGVTMATKIKAGLTPDKALKYSFQLADIMLYLQLRGVIHQNLLPENVQVMSNDRVVLCNFETAVQTDPTSCLLVVSRSVIAPSNKKGLAPEVISAFARTETATVDYSTQYPWSFAVLSILMSTGQHPLKDYPKAYESGGRLKYRSHSYQALPHPTHYPTTFCKLVKRSLSCDPIRRPTLPQILSIIKKDSKTIALVTGRRPSGRSSKGKNHDRRGISIGRNECTEQSESSVPLKHRSLRPQPASHPTLCGEVGSPLPYSHHTSNEDLAADLFHSSRSPRKRTKVKEHSPDEYNACESDVMVGGRSHDLMVRSHDATLRREERPHNQALRSYHLSSWSHESVMASGYTVPKLESDIADPFLPVDTQYSPRGASSSLHPWYLMDHPTQLSTRGSNLPRENYDPVSLRRYSSQSAFSDDFVSPGLPQGHISAEGGARSSQFSRSSENLRLLHNLQHKKVSCTSESDLSQIHDFQYERLIPSPNAIQYEERSLSHRSDQEKLLHISSPEFDSDIGVPLTEGVPVSTQGYRINETVKQMDTLSSCLPKHAQRSSSVPHTTREELLDDIALTGGQDKSPGMPQANVAQTRGGLRLFQSSDSSHSSPHQKETINIEGVVISDRSDAQMGESSQEQMEIEIDHRYLSNTVQDGRSHDVYMMSQEERSRDSMETETVPLTDNSQPTTGENAELDREVSDESKEAGRQNDQQIFISSHTSENSTPTLSPAASESLSGTALVEAMSSVKPVVLGTSEIRHDQIQQLEKFSPTSNEVYSERSSISESAVLHTHQGSLPEMLSSALCPFHDVSQGDEDLTPTETEEDGNMKQRQQNVAQLRREQPGVAGEPQCFRTGSFANPLEVSSLVETSHLTVHEMAGQSSANLVHSDIEVSNVTIEPNNVSTTTVHTAIGPTDQRSHGTNAVGFGYMSPIPEASQEFTSSQTQTTTDRQSSSQTRSEEQIRQRSISPFRHSALSDRASSPRSQSTISEHGSTLHGSGITSLTTLGVQTAAKVRHFRADSPQLEPPSSDTSRSLSITRSSSHTSGEVSTQARVNSPPPPPPLTQAIYHDRQGSENVTATNVARLKATTRATSEIGVSGVRGSTPARSNVSAPARMQDRYSRPTSPLQLSGSGFHPSLRQEQRLTDYPRGHRISQDLEMMNLAISGMDSLGRQCGLSDGHSSSPQNPADSHSRTPTTTSNGLTMKENRSFRPINPSLEQRSISARPTFSSTERTAYTQSHFPDRGNASSGYNPDPHASLPPHVSEDSYDYLPPYSPPKILYSGVASPHEAHQQSAHRGKADVPSLDEAHQQSAHRGKADVPSLDEAHQQSASPPLYPEPPPSYEEIFGRQSASNKHSRKQHSYSNTRLDQHHLGLRRTTSNQPVSGHRPLLRQGPGPRKLSSLTNLFRRSKSRQSQESHPHGPPPSRSSMQRYSLQAQTDSGDLTGSWVRGYSLTHRPLDTMDFAGREATSVVSASTVAHSPIHSHVSRTISDMTSSRPRPSRNPPIPYRHPPPFPSNGEFPGMPSSLPGAIAVSQSESSIDNVASDIHTTPASIPTSSARHNIQHGYGHIHNVIRRRGPHVRQERPRPYSEIMASDDVEIFQPSAGEQYEAERRTQNLGGSRSLSSSCFDILGPTESQHDPANRPSSDRRNKQPRPSSALLYQRTTASQAHRHLSSNGNANNTNVSENASPNTSPIPIFPCVNSYYNNSQADGNDVPSHPTARVRAITRRTRQASQYSSSDEELLDQQQPKTKLRLRRRKVPDWSQNGTTNSQLITESDLASVAVEQLVSRIDQHATQDPLRSHEQNIDPHEQQQGQPDTTPLHNQEACSADSRTPEGGNDEREREADSSNMMEIQVQGERSDGHQSTASNTQLEIPFLQGVGKPCGHRCVSHEQVQCCLCMKNQQGPMEITRLLQNCHICERRTATNKIERSTEEIASGCKCHSNSNSSCPVHTNRDQQHQPPTRVGKSCIVM